MEPLPRRKELAPRREEKPTFGLFAVVKDEAPYIEEWIAHHRAYGCTQIFIAENGSTDGCRELLQSLQASNLCHVVEFTTPAGRPPQLAAYRMLAERFAGEVDWMAFIDADEFIIADEEFASIPDFLLDFHARGEIGAIALNWACYGSAGRQHFERGFVVKRFERRADQNALINHHYKSLVRSAAFAGTGSNPHHFQLKKGFRYAAANGQPLALHPEKGAGLSSGVVWTNARLNHYVVKSHQEFFEKKALRGRATVAGQHRSESYFRGHDRNEVNEPFPDHLLERLGKEYLTVSATAPQKEYFTQPIAVCPPAPMGFGEAPQIPLYRSIIDAIERRGTNLYVKGWALAPDNGPIHDLQLCAGKTIIASEIVRTSRPDVARMHPETCGDVGFTITVSLLDPDLMTQSPLEICSGGNGVARVLLPEELQWNPDMVLPLQRPAMPPACIQAIEQALESAQVYLEFGTGGSTNLTANFPHLSVASIGSDWNVLRTIRFLIAEKGAKERTAFLFADLGPIGENGFPLDESAFHGWHRYALSPWLHCKAHGLVPDLVLIDGRFRRACLLASMIFSAPGTRILFDDYFDRPHYHTVEKHLKPVQGMERMAEFVRPGMVEPTALWVDLMEAVTDPR